MPKRFPNLEHWASYKTFLLVEDVSDLNLHSTNLQNLRPHDNHRPANNIHQDSEWEWSRRLRSHPSQVQDSICLLSNWRTTQDMNLACYKILWGSRAIDAGIIKLEVDSCATTAYARRSNKIWRSRHKTSNECLGSNGHQSGIRSDLGYR